MAQVPDNTMRRNNVEKENLMETQVARKLIPLIHDTFESLKNYDESAVSRNPAPGKWSVKEIIGHLIDSAVNNHHRFIRAQREDVFVFPNYEQAFWVDAQPYNASDWKFLLELWKNYNLHLSAVMVNIPQDQLNTECRIGNYEPVTLRFLCDDYVDHIKHHLKQIYNILETK